MSLRQMRRRIAHSAPVAAYGLVDFEVFPRWHGCKTRRPVRSHHVPAGERLGRKQTMKVILSVLAVLGALAATDASAQGVDLTGRYRCVQACRDGLVGQPAFVTQNGWNLNLVNEAGEPSRAWLDRIGRIWVQSWNEGAIYSPDGMVIQFDRGTVWQRDLGEPDVGPVPRPGGRTPVRRGVAAPPVERTVVARSAFDGNWSVVINTEIGGCDPQYRFGVQIINGNVVYEGGPANLQGRVAPNGAVWVSVSTGGQQADGQGRLSRNVGAGTWRGQGPGGGCAGSWQAARRG